MYCHSSCHHISVKERCFYSPECQQRRWLHWWDRRRQHTSERQRSWKRQRGQTEPQHSKYQERRGSRQFRWGPQGKDCWTRSKDCTFDKENESKQLVHKHIHLVVLQSLYPFCFSSNLGNVPGKHNDLGVQRHLSSRNSDYVNIHMIDHHLEYISLVLCYLRLGGQDDRSWHVGDSYTSVIEQLDWACGYMSTLLCNPVSYKQSDGLKFWGGIINLKISIYAVNKSTYMFCLWGRNPWGRLCSRTCRSMRISSVVPVQQWRPFYINFNHCSSTTSTSSIVFWSNWGTTLIYT